MAAIKSKNKRLGRANTPNPLQSLTAAALLLPGVMLGVAQAADEDEFTFQYGRYEESHRNLGDVKSQFDPISVDSLQAGSKISLTDRVKFAFNYVQDTWSGATPISTSPIAHPASSNRQGNRALKINNTIVAGASPYVQTALPVYFDKQFNPVRIINDTGTDADGNQVVEYSQANELAHTMALASPETRKEGNFKLGYEWDEAAVDVGGGISIEKDYESRFGNIGGRLDFNQKLTSLTGGVSYTNSDTSARFDHDVLSVPGVYGTYIDTSHYTNYIEKTSDGNGYMMTGNRQDWAANLGLTQVLYKDALVKFGAGYTRSTGYMANPYKAVTVFFIDPNEFNDENADYNGYVNQPYTGQIQPFLEQRPNVRDQWNFSTGYVQYINPLDAALHVDYRFFHDDWGIDAHTFEADWVQPMGSGWTVTPRLRYYTQDAADFYTPYIISKQAKRGVKTDADGNPEFDADGNVIEIPYDASKLPAHFSSDHRLSGYGALSGGLVLTKQFAKGLTLEAGFEYYNHKGSFKLGSGGESDYADFSYYTANAALKVNLESVGRAMSGGEHDHHAMHHNHGAPLPAGVMFGHVMTTPGDIMVGYRYMYSRQDGRMLHENELAADQDIVSKGCNLEPGLTCRTSPAFMNMHMHMLDIMYAPTSWLNLMVMPQFMDMDMNMRSLGGVTPNVNRDHLHGGHETGGVGDTGLYAMFKLYQGAGHDVNMGVGVTAPTGAVDIKLRRMHTKDEGYIHYGMQLGSGTWDFKPSITYTGKVDDWSWGAQVNGTKRLENRNQAGFAFGDQLQSTAWGSYSLFNWLSASVRGIYTVQGAVKHQFNAVIGDTSEGDPIMGDVNPKEGSMDNPKNYGGRYWDVGFGLNATIPSGSLAGNTFSVEWLQPVEDDVNGYQLERDGTLNATWSYGF
ncbi:MAG: DUF3570 domain-containing protein [Methylococcaceae bacterium]|nr:DUF3570 domain-containing protein [Methylococcaceae bacterium]MDP2393586.1 DUF3570 domain-containing protein [Methylococcaceae bacterium]MDP3019669.1 DUF3570 domain-containing protein [Methylococcaceae bacterium]MDP3389947.1 DUF3570 domain-containing protein [Methylococcaceae bacterium]